MYRDIKLLCYVPGTKIVFWSIILQKQANGQNKLVEKEIIFVHSRGRGWGQGGLDQGNQKVQNSTKVSTRDAIYAI